MYVYLNIRFMDLRIFLSVLFFFFFVFANHKHIYYTRYSLSKSMQQAEGSVSDHKKYIYS